MRQNESSSCGKMTTLNNNIIGINTSLLRWPQAVSTSLHFRRQAAEILKEDVAEAGVRVPTHLSAQATLIVGGQSPHVTTLSALRACGIYKLIWTESIKKQIKNTVKKPVSILLTPDLDCQRSVYTFMKLRASWKSHALNVKDSSSMRKMAPSPEGRVA